MLALQAYAFINNGDVPLRSLASLGGANSMRGYYDGRYRDKDQIVFQAEYRVPVVQKDWVQLLLAEPVMLAIRLQLSSVYKSS